MSSTAVLSRDTLLGIFELDEQGVVRYSRGGRFVRDSDRTMVGDDFFEVAPFENREDLKKHFRRFVTSQDAADTFPFDCYIDDSVIHTKISMTRAFQTEYYPPKSIVMLSINESV
jgi:hypothetical protein